MKDFGMPGVGDDSVHRSYDDIAQELRRVASRLAAPIALAARRTRLNSDRVLRLKRDQLARLEDPHTPGAVVAQQRTQAPPQSPECGR